MTVINESGLYSLNEFLEEHPMKFVDGKFYNTDGAVEIQTVKKMISDKLLAEQV